MKTTYMYIALIIARASGIIFLRNASDSSEQATLTPYDTFAQCIADSGAKFYGAYWCSHCQSQKKLFNNSKKLPYVECSTPNGQAQVQECIDKKITSYPTWIFADGSIGDGEQSFAQLSEKTNCPVPEIQQ